MYYTSSNLAWVETFYICLMMCRELIRHSTLKTRDICKDNEIFMLVWYVFVEILGQTNPKNKSAKFYTLSHQMEAFHDHDIWPQLYHKYQWLNLRVAFKLLCRWELSIIVPRCHDCIIDHCKGVPDWGL